MNKKKPAGFKPTTTRSLGARPTTAIKFSSKSIVTFNFFMLMKNQSIFAIQKRPETDWL